MPYFFNNYGGEQHPLDGEGLDEHDVDGQGSEDEESEE